MDTRIVSDPIGRVAPVQGSRPFPGGSPSTLSASNDSGSSLSVTENRPQLADRPMGIDPSIPPQSLFDASLISSAFKAQFTSPIEEISAAAAETTQPGETESTNTQ